MYKTLRILFCIIAVLGAAVTIFIFIYFGIWGIVPLGVACVSAALMTFCKKKQDRQEALQKPAPVGDFITGKAESNASTSTDGGDKEKSGKE